MRWYVSRNGETIGPVDDAQVATWIRGGMVDGMIRDEQGGQWMPLASSPFRTLIPMHERGLGHRLAVGAGLGVLGFAVGTLVFGFEAGLVGGVIAGGIGLIAGNVKLA